ncbi:gtp-binding protein [Cystoisospora suis]|uniref:Gtp-binding protein n=1 Tax=Cystoisospora suis TaxID=483139 RepID=A0A2C6KIQ0_9APIC|nr:gtp-binding protein [Cystoisospora suis]
MAVVQLGTLRGAAVAATPSHCVPRTVFAEANLRPAVGRTQDAVWCYTSTHSVSSPKRRPSVNAQSHSCDRGQQRRSCNDADVIFLSRLRPSGLHYNARRAGCTEQVHETRRTSFPELSLPGALRSSILLSATHSRSRKHKLPSGVVWRISYQRSPDRKASPRVFSRWVVTMAAASRRSNGAFSTLAGRVQPSPLCSSPVEGAHHDFILARCEYITEHHRRPAPQGLAGPVTEPFREATTSARGAGLLCKHVSLTDCLGSAGGVVGASRHRTRLQCNVRNYNTHTGHGAVQLRTRSLDLLATSAVRFAPVVSSPQRKVAHDGATCDPVGGNEVPRVLLLHVLIKGGERGHSKGMRRKTREEILWEVKEAIGLARAANWRVVRGPSTPNSTGFVWPENSLCGKDADNSGEDVADQGFSICGDKDMLGAVSIPACSLSSAKVSEPARLWRQSGMQAPVRAFPFDEEAAGPSPVNTGATLVSGGDGKQFRGATLDFTETAHSSPAELARDYVSDAMDTGVPEALILPTRPRCGSSATMDEREPRGSEFCIDGGDALAASCVIVIRQENPSYLLGKGKLQEVLAFFARTPTPLVFINCSNAYTAVPLPESLASRESSDASVPAGATRQSAAAVSPPRDETCSVGSDSPELGDFVSVTEPGKTIGLPKPTDYRAAFSHETEGCMFGLHGYYSKGRSVAGRLMSSCSNERTGSGLRPMQQQLLQQAFEAALMATAAAAAEDWTPLRRQQRGRVPNSRGDGGGGDALDGQNTGAVVDACGDAETSQPPCWLPRKQSVEVVDRQRVILEIFSRHSQSNKQAMLQVALARVAYFRSRLLSGSVIRRRQLMELIRGVAGAASLSGAQWVHEVTQQYIPSPRGSKGDFERQQVDMVLNRLRDQVKKEATARVFQRRKRAGVPVLALVGYTNAGKTRLLNSLTKGHTDLLSEDRLFCTLDTKLKQLRLPNGLRCILMDSIGFIQGLPLSLFPAFQATLDELMSADIILHVVDVSHPMWQQQRRVVLQTLYQHAKAEAAKRETRPGFEEMARARKRELLKERLRSPLHALEHLHTIQQERQSNARPGDAAAHNFSDSPLSMQPSLQDKASSDAHCGSPSQEEAETKGARECFRSGKAVMAFANRCSEEHKALAGVIKDVEKENVLATGREFEAATAAAYSEQAWEEVKLVEREMGQGATQILEVWTKVDLITSEERLAALLSLAPPNAVLVSSLDGTGLRLLTRMLEESVVLASIEYRPQDVLVSFPPEKARGVFALLQDCQVKHDVQLPHQRRPSTQPGTGGEIQGSEFAHVAVQATARQLGRLLKKYPCCTIRKLERQQQSVAP